MSQQSKPDSFSWVSPFIAKILLFKVLRQLNCLTPSTIQETEKTLLNG